MFIITTAIQSDTCWDGVNAVDYTGTVSTTSSGITCQAWADDSPQTHVFHGNSYFPYDGDDVAASNYCRDPDGLNGAFGPYCFTMDPSTRYETCTIPICPSKYFHLITVREYICTLHKSCLTK